jgi:hypothetical protein
MAKAKTTEPKPGGKTVRVVTETVENRLEDDELELPEPPVDDEAAEDNDAIAELEALAGSGARYEIRRTAPTGFTGYVGTYYRDTFTPDLLRTEWGGGNFTLRVKGSKGEYLGSRQIVLAGDAHHKKDPVTPAPAQGGDNGMGAVLAAMNAGNQAAQKASEGQIAMLTTLVTSLINRPAPAAPAAPDPIAMIAALKGIMKPESSEGGAVKMLLQGIELGKSLGESGGETNMMDLVAKGFDVIKDAAAVAPTPAPTVPKRLPAPIAVTSTPNNPGAPAAAPGTVPAEESAPVSDQMKQMQWLRNQAAMLCKLAEKGKDPELYAEVFLDNLPPFLPAQLVYDTMNAPGAIAKLSMLVPQVAQHAEWFEKFRATVIELLEGDPDDAGETDPPALTPVNGEESGEDQLDVGGS